MLSSQWHNLLLQTLHNDYWRTRHTDIPDYTGPQWSQVDTTSSDSWSIAESDSDDSLLTFEPEYFVTCDLPDALQPGQGPHTIDPTIFIAGLIKTIWIELATLWRSHLDLIHQTAETTTSPVTRAESITRVRALQVYHATVEAFIRTPTYFPTDIDNFLETSSLQQLQNYIEQHSPIIMASHARYQATYPTPHMPNISEGSHAPSTSSTPPSERSQHHALEESQHRKRNRRRNLSTGTPRSRPPSEPP
jgi:hypothetical protein